MTDDELKARLDQLTKSVDRLTDAFLDFVELMRGDQYGEVIDLLRRKPGNGK